MPQQAKLLVRVFDGTRQPIRPDKNLLITIRDGFQKEFGRKDFKASQVSFQVPFFNNLCDNYTVIVYAKGYKQAGFTPIKVSTQLQQVVDIMLLPQKGKFRFRHTKLAELKESNPKLFRILSHGAADTAKARKRYSDLVEQPKTLAALLNIVTAIQQIHLPQGTPLDYLIELLWDVSMQQDRFFAYGDKALIEQIKLATEHGEFAPEPGAGFFHKGATLSYKQIQFGEANVQLSFHENDSRMIDGIDCVKVEPDIDYFRDLGAHALLEVVPNHITGGLTDPEQVYLLRWIAGRRAGLPEFDPPYTIEAA